MHSRQSASGARGSRQKYSAGLPRARGRLRRAALFPSPPSLPLLFSSLAFPPFVLFFSFLFLFAVLRGNKLRVNEPDRVDLRRWFSFRGSFLGLMRRARLNGEDDSTSRKVITTRVEYFLNRVSRLPRGGATAPGDPISRARALAKSSLPRTSKASFKCI